MLETNLKINEIVDDYKRKLELFPKAVNSAINKASTQTRNKIAKEIGFKWNISKEDIKNSFKISRSTWQTMRASIDAYGGGMSLTRFGTKVSTKPKRGPAGVRRYLTYVKIRRGKPFRVSTKIFQPPGYHTYFKINNRTGKIIKAYGPGLAYMFGKDVQAEADKHLKKIFPDIVQHEINYFYYS